MKTLFDNIDKAIEKLPSGGDVRYGAEQVKKAVIDFFDFEKETDKEKIINGLLTCILYKYSGCDGCPYEEETKCIKKLAADITILINNYEREIDRINKELEEIKKGVNENA